MHMIKTVGTAVVLLFGTGFAAFAQDAPTDPQIAHIAYTAGVLDIEAANLALSKSTNPTVTEFAQSMVNDHRAVNEQALALVEKLGLTPEDNAASQALTAAAEAKRAELAALEGGAFDVAYIENEIAYHQQVNDALANFLIPSAQNAELKALLETGLTLFQGHQQHAEAVAAELE